MGWWLGVTCLEYELGLGPETFCTMRSDASRIMVTWGPPFPCGHTHTHTHTHTCQKHYFPTTFWRAVKSCNKHKLTSNANFFFCSYQLKQHNALNTVLFSKETKIPILKFALGNPMKSCLCPQQKLHLEKRETSAKFHHSFQNGNISQL